MSQPNTHTKTAAFTPHRGGSRAPARRSRLTGPLIALIAAASGRAEVLTWDNTAGGGINDGAGAWLGTGLWNNGAPSDTWTSGDDAIFGVGGTGGAVTLASPTTVNSLTFNNFSGTYTLGTAGQTITLNAGITKNAGSGAVSLLGPITLGGNQTWTNNSNAGLTTGNGSNLINLGGFQLTVDGTGDTNWGVMNNTAVTLAGTGTLIKNGTGRLNIGGSHSSPTLNVDVIVNGGVLQVHNADQPLGNGNVTLNGGVMSWYWGANHTRTLGTGSLQVQIPGGESGFAGSGTTGPNINLGASVVWGALGEGAATGFFNPSKFVLGDPTTGNAAATTFSSGINLNGASRTIVVPYGLSAAGNSSNISGSITNGPGTGSLVKEGGGNLTLSNASNPYIGSTTISQGTLTANSSAALGNGSATNTLIFNGGSLRAGGAITSPATRALTLNSTATIDSNNFAVRIDGDVTGAAGLIKNGANTLTLAGSNSYAGPTVVNAGGVHFAKEASLYGGNTVDWTAANLNLKGGTTLGLNVDSAGTSGFTAANLTTLLGSVSVANSASSGIQAGVTLALDTSTATAGTFTPGSAITDSTGAFGGRVSLIKQGAGTLVVNQANTYTGPTTISAGTLQLDAGGALSTAPLHVNGGTLAVNRTGTITQGTHLASIIGGTGSLANVGSGTLALNAPTFHTGNTTATAGNITLSHARAIQNSALDTTGAGSVTLSGVTAPVFGGLSNSGAARNLASVIDASYGAVSGITLNPQSGLTYTYAGVIANGASGMSLTMAGPGSQILTGNNLYTGTTILNQGTLQAGTNASIGRLNTSTGYTFNGGTLQFNRSTNANIDALSDTAPIISNGGTLAARSIDAGGGAAIENIGAATVSSGQMNFNWINGASSGAQMILAGLTMNSSLTAAGQTAAVTFSGNLGSTGRWGVTGSGTTTAGQIIGPWATTGAQGGVNAQTDYAVYGANYVAAANIGASAENTWGAGANATLGGTASLSGNRTLNTLRYSGGAGALDLGANNLETYGLLNGGGGILSVTGTGALRTPTGGGNLFLTAGNNDITMNAPVSDNGGAVTIVKSGSRTLGLGSTANTFSGGLVINAGQVTVNSNANLGATGSGITFNGNANLSSGVDTTLVDLGTRPITINNGAIATFSGGSRPNIKIGGAITGNGGVTLTHGTFWGKIELASTANTFTGPLTVTSNGDDGNNVFKINSIADGAGYGNIILNNASNDGDLIGLDYGSGGANGAGGGGATAALTLTHRQIVVATSGNNVLNNSSAQAININSDIAFSGTGARAMRFGVQARAGSGVSTFAGKLTDNAGGVFTPTFGGGNWVLSGANTYTGKTSINAGLLSINSIQNAGSAIPNALGMPVGASSVIDLAANATLRYTGSGHSSDRVINFTGTGNGTYRLDASGAGTFGLTGGITSAGTSGTSILRLEGTGRGEIGSIGTGSNTTALHKAGSGTWTLTSGSTYNGSTTVFDGSLALGAANVIPNGSTLTVTGSTSVFDLGANQSETLATVTLQGGGSILGSGTSTLITTGTFNLQSGTVTAALGGAGRNINKTTTGTVTLEGINTYTGSTDLSAAGSGTLVLSHPSSSNNISSSHTINVGSGNFLNVTGLSGGQLELASGQTLKGSGTVTGGLVIGGGGRLAPGASPGTLNTVGGVTYAPAGTYAWEVNNATGTKGVDQGWDWHNITGALNITGTVATPHIIDIIGLNTGNALGTVANWNPLVSRTWIIATASGGITGFSTSAFSLNTANFFNNNSANSLGAAAFSLTQSGNDLVLNFSGSGTASSYWDTNGTTSGAGATPNGTWSNGGGLFSYSVGGTLATGNWVPNNVAVFAAGTGAGTYTVTISGGVSASGIVVEDGAMTLNSSTLTLAGATPHITVDSAQPLTVNSVLLGTAGMTKLGNGTATLTAANTYTGSTTLSAGRVQLGGAPVGSVGSIVSSEIGRGTLVFNGGALSSADTAARTVLNPVLFNGNGTIGDATNNGAVNFSDAVDLGSATRTITVAANSEARFNQTVSGASGVGIVVRGDGALVPNAANTYDGPTTIGGGVGLTGTIRIESGNELALGANPASFNQNQLRLNGGTLRISAADLTIDDSNRGLSVGSGGGTFEVDANRTLSLSTPGTFEAASVGSTFFKTGTGTFNLSAAANFNALRVEEGVYRQSAGTTAVSESSGTGLRIASGAVYDLAGGILRTDRIQEIAGGTFSWGAGRLTAYTSNDTDGTVDFSSSAAPVSPVVSVGRTVDISASSVETTAGSILQAHGSPTLYANLGTRFNNYSFSGILNLNAAGDILEVDLNPSLLRPTAAYVEFGSIPLVYADSILGVFDQFLGVSADALPFDQYLGVYITSLPPTQMPPNSWYLEYAKNVVNPTAAASPATNGSGTFDVIYFHYNFGVNSVNVPEPATLPLVAAGVWALRFMRRRRQDVDAGLGPASPARGRRRSRLY